jgi:sugar (pentulose or hexulose) kinase
VDRFVAATKAGVSGEEHLNALASAVPAGSDGLLCVLDWLAPPTQLYKKGMFIGFDEHHGYAHMYRAILEGIAFTMKKNMTAMETERNIRLETLVLSGGGSHSDLFAQIFADVFNIPVVRNVVRNASGLGAAICAAVACDVYPNFDEASKHMVRREDQFEPDPENVELYAQLGAVSAEIPARTDAILERTHAILLAHKGVASHA